MANPSSSSESMLVRNEHLDELLLLAGEVIIASSNQGLNYRSLQSLFDKSAPVDHASLDAAKDLAASTALLSSELHHLVQAIRTVTLKDLGFRARRLVRDVARKTGKRVRFEFEGEDTTVDKTIVERLYDPIAHQIRNAIDHGIEDGLTRTRKGKPEEGSVTLRAYNTEQETFIEIEDDGAGIDLDAMRQRGIDMGRVDPNAPFTEEDALHLMMQPGFSMAKSVSEVSGRGVGMDVVHQGITEVGGSVSFSTELGKGTKFIFQVPLISAVNIVDALVVRAGVFRLAFPIANVVATISVDPSSLTSTLGKGLSVKYLDRLLPLQDLAFVLNGTRAEREQDRVSILIVEHKGPRVAFEVSEFYSPQKLVIIPFEEGFTIEGLVGTTVLGGRQLGFIVDVPALLDMALGRKRALRGVRVAAAAEGGPEGPPEEAAAETEISARPDGAKAAADVRGEALIEDQSDLAREFVGETEKLVPALNEAVFRLEANPQDDEHINNAFRMLHTVKGNLIMMGLPKGGQTVHAVESVLDRARSKAIQLTPDVVDILMDGVAYIEEVVRSAKSGTWKDQEAAGILEASAQLLPQAEAAPEEMGDVASAEFRLSHEAIYRANNHRRRQTPFYQCYVEFDSGSQPSFLVACLIYKRICEFGDALATVPLLSDIEKGIMEGKVKVLLATTIEPDVLDAQLTALLTAHYGARAVQVTRFG